jgi:nicotinamidase-related amidase
MAEDLSLDRASTALVVVDVQNFAVGLPLQPLSGREVLDNCVRLAKACREAGIPVVLVRVGYDPKVPQLRPHADRSFSGFEFPPGAKEIAPELGPEPDDIIVDKYNWGSFYGTDLDVHLRRRGVRTLIMCGLVTNIGVDTTMRHAQERGYDQLLASDAVSAFSLEEHEYVLKYVAPRLSRVRTTDAIVAAIRN